MTQIKTALISVSDKTGIEDLGKFLDASGIKVLSTGGSAKALRTAGVNVTDVSDVTGFPEIMNGRVKTLHPKIHGGLLAKRDDKTHTDAMEEHGIGGIDLLVVNLYPFQETVASGADFDTCIENIDIGGPAMIRAAAKNHKFVATITSPSDYDMLKSQIEAGDLTQEFRTNMAVKAFKHTAQYDTKISCWMYAQTANEFPEKLLFGLDLKNTLRYGENPHQEAALYVDGSNRVGVTTAIQHHGKELSYNNINDTDAAFELVSEFTEKPAVAIIKHANPCGVAIGETLVEAYQKALRCDPISAFGGIIALNRTLDLATAELISELFAEVVIAPDMDEDAKTLLMKKKNLRLLTTGKMPDPTEKGWMTRSVSGGYLVQSKDNGQITSDDLKTATTREPETREIDDMLFAWKVAKHIKSNAIIYAKDGATVGIGAGQMSRVDSTKVAVHKAEMQGIDLTGSVVASDAFFPFADGLLNAAEAGVTAVIQPGGSVRDEEVINAANDKGISMVFTGMRHFKH